MIGESDRLVEGANPPHGEIHTEAQALNYLQELLVSMQRARAACDIPYQPQGPDTPTTKELCRIMWIFLVRQGKLLGALNALRMAGLLSDRAWAEMHQQALNALAPTVTSTILPH